MNFNSVLLLLSLLTSTSIKVFAQTDIYVLTEKISITSERPDLSTLYDHTTSNRLIYQDIPAGLFFDLPRINVVSGSTPLIIHNYFRISDINSVNIQRKYFQSNLELKINQSQYSDHFVKHSVVDINNPAVKSIIQSIGELAADGKFLRNKDLNTAFREEISYSLSGSSDIIPARNYATIDSKDGAFSFGHTSPINANNKPVRLLLTVGLKGKTIDDELILTGPLASDPALKANTQITIFKTGNLKGGTARYGNTAIARLNKLDTFYYTKILPLDIGSIPNGMQKQIVDKVTKEFFDTDLAEFRENNSGFRFIKKYIFFRGLIGLQNQRFLLLEATSLDTLQSDPYLEHSLSGGVGILMRQKKIRHNFESNIGFSKSNTVLSKVTELETRLLQKDPIGSTYKEETIEYITGDYKSFIIPSLEARYTGSVISESRSKSIGIGWNINLKYSPNTVESHVGSDYKPFECNLGPLVYLNGKKEKTAVIVYPHLSVQNGTETIRISAGVPF